MRRIWLTPAEQAQLEHPCKATSDRRLRDRCQAVLMASRGRERKAIAQDLGVHRTTVQLWRKQYHQHGLEGLPIQWAPGRSRRIPATLAPTIQAWGKGGPQGAGWIERTGPMRRWLRISIRPRASRSSAPRCATSASATGCGRIGRPLTLCGEPPSSSRKRGKSWRR